MRFPQSEYVDSMGEGKPLDSDEGDDDAFLAEPFGIVNGDGDDRDEVE